MGEARGACVYPGAQALLTTLVQDIFENFDEISDGDDDDSGEFGEFGGGSESIGQRPAEDRR